MGDDITIGVTEIVNNIEVTAQPSDQVIEIDVVDNSDDVTLNITPTVIEININKGSSFARWGTILGNLPDQADLQNVLNLKADLVGGLVPASQLPSYVDDIVEVANYAALPVVGETGKIYLTLDNNKIFRWSGSVYIEVAANNAIWGAITGTLSSQTDLQTALDTKALKTTTITINGTSYDLSENRSWTIPTHDAVTIGTANGLSLVGQSLSLGLASSINTGALSAENWATFNSKIGGSGNLNYIPKFTSSSAIGNSLLYDNGTNVFVGGSGSNDYRFNVVEGATLNGQQILMQNVSSSKEALHIVHIGTGNLIKGTKASAVEVFNVTNSGGAYFAGSVGIGTTSPSGIGTVLNLYGGSSINSNLVLEGNSGNSFLSILSSATNGVPPSFMSKDGFRFAYASDKSATGFAEHLRITSGGNVGIGTTSPNYSSVGRTVVDINGTSQSMLALSVGGVGKGFLFYTGTDLLLSNETNGSIGFNANGDRRVTILPSGNVGIGTTSPAEILHLQSSQPVIRYTRTGILNWKVGVISGNTFTINNDSTGGDVLNITSGGNVGIGTASPVGKLQVFSDRYNDSLTFNAAAGFIIGGSIRQLSINTDDTSPYGIGFQGKTNSNSAANIYFQSLGGNVGIGTTSPSYTLHVNGSVAGTSAYVNLSDKRHKKDILPIENALDKILALNGVTFNWDKESTDMNLDDDNHIGLLAQDVEEIIPQAVVTSTDDNKTKSVAYTDLVPVLIEAIKELTNRINILENK